MRLLSAVLLASCAFAAGELSNRRAPGFSLPDNSTKQFDLLDYRGKVILLDFMQVSCPHCATFSKILEKVKAKYGDKIAILSVVNPPSDRAAVAKYITDNKTTTPILFDCGQVAYSYLMPKSQSIPIPHVFLIDGQGQIRNDIAYSDTTKTIFEGNGIFAEIDRVLAAPPSKK